MLNADDRHAISDLVGRYAWALDTGDVDRFVSCFSEDGTLVWDAFEEPDTWVGAEALRAFASFLRDLPSTAGRQHHVSNLIIEGGPDVARARSYVMVVFRQDEGPHPTTMTGWYDDVLTRGAHGWKIKHRTICDWSGPVLARLAGQTGERVARARPPVLAGLRSLARDAS